MPGSETKPTPASGMPAAMAATSAAKPSLDEISAPRSETGTILLAIAELRTEFIGRFEHLEKTTADLKNSTAQHAHALGTLTNQVAEHTKNIADQASAITSIAKSAATAAELSAQALKGVNTAKDDTRKMVESAMAIQKGAIESTVREVVKPILDDVDGLKTSGAKQTEAVSAIVNELGIEDRVELGRDVKPGEKITPAFEKLEKRAKSSTIVQAIIAIGIVAELLSRVLTHH